MLGYDHMGKYMRKSGLGNKFAFAREFKSLNFNCRNV